MFTQKLNIFLFVQNVSYKNIFQVFHNEKNNNK